MGGRLSVSSRQKRGLVGLVGNALVACLLFKLIPKFRRKKNEEEVETKFRFISFSLSSSNKELSLLPSESFLLLGAVRHVLILCTSLKSQVKAGFLKDEREFTKKKICLWLFPSSSLPFYQNRILEKKKNCAHQHNDTHTTL